MNIELVKNPKTNRSLVARLNDKNEVIEFIVCSNFDAKEKEGFQWDGGSYYNKCLQKAVDDLYDLLPRERLEDIAILLKDGLFTDDYKSALSYITDIIRMNDDEKEFFGIE